MLLHCCGHLILSVLGTRTLGITVCTYSKRWRLFSSPWIWSDTVIYFAQPNVVEKTSWDFWAWSSEFGELCLLLLRSQLLGWREVQARPWMIRNHTEERKPEDERPPWMFQPRANSPLSGVTWLTLAIPRRAKKKKNCPTIRRNNKSLLFWASILGSDLLYSNWKNPISSTLSFFTTKDYSIAHRCQCSLAYGI